MKADATRHPGRLAEWGAAVFSFAEATVFFIVPDVWLTTWAVMSARRAMVSCLFAVAGALAGGTVMYLLGQADADVVTLVERTPAVSVEMVNATETAVRERGVWSMFSGILAGTPYKLFAALAGALDVGLGLFLLVSVPARLSRFLGLVILTTIAARVTRRWVTVRTQTIVLLSLWLGFYIAFFLWMPN